MKPIFEYTDYREFLRDIILEKKKKQSSYSVRLLSQKSGIKSAGFLSMVLHYKRNITSELAEKIAVALGLSKREASYFQLMVEFSQAKRIEFRQEILQQMLACFRPVDVRNLLSEQFEFYDKWYYSVMRELVEIMEVNDSNNEIVANYFDPPLRTREVRQSLQILSRLGLIYKDRQGNYKRRDTMISCGEDVKSVVVSNFQSTMISLAGSALKRISREQRDFSTVTLSIDEETFGKIKKICNNFRKELLSVASRVEYPDRIIQVNLQCFPVSKVESHSKISGRTTEENSGENQ